ncbi:mannosyl-3-phosphoglycerate phosphatase-related protein [Candidatus Sodalis endolongispinus]|uniref:Mannosyl-3-phosphoglycerate phosphatase-related protein n=1 Tax=Candidatus Sodalis endolongispinus TaxID=2812662 RepID=A0ABS5YDA0_9GAMM|nr:mannosyl-3-phosphoglycerate phosphatase-related protein [Candidatus Sodalis endolongispinus]MBT9432968.1 mannosyl-3-phosphoglycerate phosphatase-related protein [Candidatus Sodalis endolongispinus]
MPSLTDPLLVITDLDGSLLDHHTYSWQPAAPWLAKLKAKEIPIVICSSKTTVEIVALQAQLGLIGSPFIAENGAALQLDARWPNAQASAGNFTGKDYISLRAVMTRLREAHGYKFFGFGDVTANEVAEWTGLSLKEAQLAKTREASEALIWRDTDDRLAAFAAELAAEDLAITEGGRFYHVMSRGSGKGAAVRWLVSQYHQHDGRAWQTLGLGDGPNDSSMLEEVDFAVIIRGYSKTPVALSTTHPAIYRTHAFGPEGWREGLDHFITEA